MKTHTYLLVFLFCFFNLSATVYTDETFNYSSTNLANESSWTTAGTLTTGTGRTIVSTPLVYTSAGKTYILSGVGKTLNSSITSSSDYKSYKPFFGAAVSSGAIYMSFLYNPAVAQSQTNTEVMGMADGTNQGPRLWAGKGSVNASNFRLGLTRGITSGPIWGTTEFSDVTQTMLIVLKYDFSNSTASVFINPVLGNTTEPVADIVDNSTSTFRTQLNNIWFRCTGSSSYKFNIGGVRVASSWSEIIVDKSTPQLSAPVVGTASSISGEEFTANWTPVSNAQSYGITLYKGATLVGTYTASGASTSSLLITGLLPNTSYSYLVKANGDVSNFTDSDNSQASSTFQTLNTGIASISANFSDGTWGATVSPALTSGSYPSSILNDFVINYGYLYASTKTCTSGVTHSTAIVLDRASYGATIEFPILKTIGELEIHACTGSTGNSFKVEEFVNNVWETIGTYATIKTYDSVYVIPISRSVPTKLRIANNTSSGLFIYKISTLTLQQANELTLKSSTPSDGEICFSNLKKSITLTYTKSIAKASGTILLNGVEIPLSNCIITNNVVEIPVSLTTTPSVDKDYTFSITAGTFAELGNPTNTSKAFSVSFKTNASVAYPSNYSAQMDVVYKSVNSPNCRMDIYYPTNATTNVPIVINVHGGGWVGGYKEEQGGFDIYFNKGYAVANVEYRMRNESLAPSALQDVRGAMLYVLNHAAELHVDKSKIIYQGGSAGAHLATTAGYLLNNKTFDVDCAPYTDEVKIMAVIDKYGPSDLVTFAPVYPGLVLWLGAYATDVDFMKSMSPIQMVNANTPPTYIIHGDADPTIPITQSQNLFNALQLAGVKSKFTTVIGGGHGGFTTEYTTQMENEIITFIDEVLAQKLQTASVKTNDAKMKVFSSGKLLKIEAPEVVTVSVFNSLGKLLFETQNKEIKLNDTGVFIIKLKSAHDESVMKMVVE